MLLKPIVLALGKTMLGFMRGIRRLLAQTRLLWSIILASLLLAGCVQYDVGVNFDSPNKGEIVQSIKLGERLTAFSSETAQEWLNSLERRAKQLQGSTKRISDKELTVTIPFNYGAELEQKFNQFFNPTEKGKEKPFTTSSADLPEIKSHLSLRQNNFLLFLRNRLSYDLDLRSLSLLSAQDNILIIDPGSLLNLEFRLNTPWGARIISKGENTISPESLQNGHQLIWKLQPGQLNHLEAVFWLPSPLGIGAVAIALFVAAGIYVKNNLLPRRARTSPLAQ